MPGLWTDPEDIPKNLSSPTNTPSKHVAGDLGAKYGDIKTASTGGVVDALRAVMGPRQSEYRHIYNSRKGGGNGSK